MWILYLLSYYEFSNYLNSKGVVLTWFEIYSILFTKGITHSTIVNTVFNNNLFNNNQLIIICYILTPSIMLLIISYLFKTSDNYDGNYINLIPHLDKNERLNFLDKYFRLDNKEYINNYIRINKNISIIRDYSAGSNATTMLCMDSKNTFFRKYAYGEDGDKLYKQLIWLKENDSIIQLPEVINFEKTEDYCFYDMKFSSSCVGLFEYVHSMPIEKSWDIIESTLNHLEKTLYRSNISVSCEQTVSMYIDKKVLNNLYKIKKDRRIKNLLQYDNLYINDIEYKNLSYFEKYLSKEYLMDIFKNDVYSTIHGDLTIENIVCVRKDDGKDDFYIIDPNTENLHNSPNLDYAKLLQSLHGCYEFLMSTEEISINDNRINFLFTKSSAYIELYKKLHNYMLNNFGLEKTRSIYFHEIIHWLRLMPYKIEKNGKRSLLFFAGMIMVMNDVISMYGEK